MNSNPLDYISKLNFYLICFSGCRVNPYSKEQSDSIRILYYHKLTHIYIHTYIYVAELLSWLREICQRTFFLNPTKKMFLSATPFFGWAKSSPIKLSAFIWVSAWSTPMNFNKRVYKDTILWTGKRAQKAVVWKEEPKPTMLNPC